MNNQEIPTFDSAKALLDFAQKHGVDTENAPIDIDKIASLLNIEVQVEHSIENHEVIGSIRHDGTTAKIFINLLNNSYAPRLRFTLAHELGHFCLHLRGTSGGFTDNAKTMNRSESYWDNKEFEANSFAAQLLMPKNLILKHGNEILNSHKRNNDSQMPSSEFVDSMARKFLVSNPAMEYRLKNLEIL
jgi:Zn-dependent peptidase ImmA (M78 family)